MDKLEFFESIDKFPLERFNAFNKYVMLDSELGSTIQDFDKNVIRIGEFINKEMIDEAKNELRNLRLVVNLLSIIFCGVISSPHKSQNLLTIRPPP